jgi:hypothetical protein
MEYRCKKIVGFSFLGLQQLVFWIYFEIGFEKEWLNRNAFQAAEWLRNVGLAHLLQWIQIVPLWKGCAFDCFHSALLSVPLQSNTNTRRGL